MSRSTKRQRRALQRSRLQRYLAVPAYVRALRHLAVKRESLREIAAIAREGGRWESSNRVAFVGYLLTWGAFVGVLALYAFCASGCANRAPGDLLGLKRPEELTTICHEGITYKFNRTMAQRHLAWHDRDYPGECREGT